MLRRTKSSSLLPIVRLTNYFYPDAGKEGIEVMDLEGNRRGSGSLTPPPDYEQLYEAMQVQGYEGIEEERVRKKYACQGRTPILEVRLGPARRQR